VSNIGLSRDAGAALFDEWDIFSRRKNAGDEMVTVLMVFVTISCIFGLW
jgi:hypothetical protein